MLFLILLLISLIGILILFALYKLQLLDRDFFIFNVILILLLNMVAFW